MAFRATAVAVSLLAAGIVPAGPSRAPPPGGGSACVARASAYGIRNGESGFAAVARDLNAFVGSTVARDGGVALPDSAVPFVAQAGIVRVEAGAVSCGEGGAVPDLGDPAPGSAATSAVPAAFPERSAGRLWPDAFGFDADGVLLRRRRGDIGHFRAAIE